jgi:hypothetical protein
MFDPYHKWLGIPPKDQPPNHYRLLGVDLFESDPDVIDAAANKQMAYLQGCAIGPQVALSQKLLNEVAAARLCLLDPKKKAAYDALLKRQVELPSHPVTSHFFTQPKVAPVKAPPAESVFASVTSTPMVKRPKQKSKGPLLVLGVAAALGLVTLIASLFLMSGDKQDKETPKVAEKQRVAQVSEQKGSPPARPDRWTVLFRADDPSLWNTDTHKGDQFAVPLHKAPEGIRYLRLRRMDTGEALIVPVTPGCLFTERLPPPKQDGAWWNGTAKKEFEARHLGIAEVPGLDPPSHPGIISIMYDRVYFYSGSGFGNKCMVNDKQYYCWRGKEIPRTVFEIAVTAEPLTDAEKRSLIHRVAQVSEQKGSPLKSIQVYLSSMPVSNVRSQSDVSGYWFQTNGNVREGSGGNAKQLPIEVNGVKSPHGIWQHGIDNSYSSATFKIDRKYARLKTVAAIPQVFPNQGDPGSPLTCEVLSTTALRVAGPAGRSSFGM